ncbi:MAG TPA: hypothetical protein VFQ56_08785, partial [Flavobacterium sp.]|nr:hypothetical protein [Flavobacterium sp.]
GVYYGTSYNSYYDVPVAVTTDAVINKSAVTGVTATDALNNLNILKEDLTNKQNSLTADVSNTKYPTVTAVNTGLAAKQNTLTNPITGTGTRTASYMPIFSGTNTISNGRIYDSGVGMSFGGSTVFGGYEFLIPAIGNNSIYLGVADGVKNPRAYISHQTTSSTQNVVFGSAFSSGSTMADWIFESGNVRINNLAGTDTRNVAADSNGNLVISSVDSRPYKVYTALISQSSTSAPTATVLENTLGGTVTWSRTSTGIYNATVSGLFTNLKTAVFVQGGGSSPSVTVGDRVDSNTCTFQTRQMSTGTYLDSAITNGTVEIRVYN